jgi:hypothetical protein
MAVTLLEEAEVAQDEIRARTSERDEDQLQIDTEVKNLHAAWDKAKRPAPGPKAPYSRYVVPKDDRAELKNMIRRAARLHKVNPVFFKDAVTPSGNYQVKFNLAPATVSENGEATDTKE